MRPYKRIEYSMSDYRSVTEQTRHDYQISAHLRHPTSKLHIAFFIGHAYDFGRKLADDFN